MKKQMMNFRLIDDTAGRLIDAWNVEMDADMDDVMRIMIETFHNIDKITGRTRNFHVEKKEITIFT